MSTRIQQFVEQNRYRNPGPFPPSELIIVDGCIYHLNIKPGELAKNIILVGDPGRAREMGKKYLKDVEFEREHRGLVTTTGAVKDYGTMTGSTADGERISFVDAPQYDPHDPARRVTFTTSQMGQAPLSVVVNELILLNEVDFKTRMRKDRYDSLNIIRVGTSGALQEETVLGMPVITTYAIGQDNNAFNYEVPCADEVCEKLEKTVFEQLNAILTRNNSRWANKWHPYASKATPEVVKALKAAADEKEIKCIEGITVSSPDFFNQQGRDVSRIPLSIPDIDGIYSRMSFEYTQFKPENMEMESSFLFHILAGHGYNVGTICLPVANRRLNSFISSKDLAIGIENITDIALKALEKLDRQHK